MLRGKKVLLGVTASIAAYKSAYLTRLLIKEGAEVKVVMTPSSRDFITPLTLSTLSKYPVYWEYFKGSTGEWNSHIELAEWADLFVIAPLSANTMGKMVHGICDNLLLATYLSSRRPLFFAPAMDLEMYRQPAVQENIETLQSMGHILIPPTSGELASGLEGEGRMEDPENIVKKLRDFQIPASDFVGKKLLVTAGPTQEHLDPVRYISNHSSGKMGLAIAAEAVLRGAEVRLIHGPMQLKALSSVKSQAIQSADQMYAACKKGIAAADIFIMCAAVSDYKPARMSSEKMKKGEGALDIMLIKNRDILAELGKEKKNGQVFVGFALETENEVKNARAKLKSKNLDLIVLNSLKDKGSGFGHDTNKVTLIDAKGKTKPLPLMTKREVAAAILDRISGKIK